MNCNRGMNAERRFLQQYGDRLFDDELQIIIGDRFVLGFGVQLQIYER